MGCGVPCTARPATSRDLKPQSRAPSLLCCQDLLCQCCGAAYCAPVLCGPDMVVLSVCAAVQIMRDDQNCRSNMHRAPLVIRPAQTCSDLLRVDPASMQAVLAVSAAPVTD